MAAVTTDKEPNSYIEAVKDPKWRKTMTSEIKALENNRTWTMGDLPPRKKVLGCKWVYQIKYNSDETIECYKAHLVIIGNNQVEGMDYNEMFTPLVSMVTVRTFLLVAAAKGWQLH